MSEPTDDTDEGLFPVQSKWLSIGFYCFILIWMGYLIIEIWQFTESEDYTFPLIIGSVVVVLSLLQLIITRYPNITARVIPSTDDEIQKFEVENSTSGRGSKIEKEKYEIYVIGWILILPVMMYVIGLGWTLISYSFVFVYFFTRDIRLSAMTSIIVVVFVWILFVELLSIIVWDGLLGIPDPLDILANIRN